MQPRPEQLVVRQHERFHCRLASLLRVSSEDAEQVTLARSIGDGTGAVPIAITDASRGGLGVESSVFFPRGCRLIVRVVGGPDPLTERDLTVRVQRVTMVDRKPTYYLGLSFQAKGPEHDRCVQALLDLARQNAASTAAAPGREAPR